MITKKESEYVAAVKDPRVVDITQEPSRGDVRKLMPINNLICSILTLRLPLADGT